MTATKPQNSRTDQGGSMYSKVHRGHRLSAELITTTSHFYWPSVYLSNREQEASWDGFWWQSTPPLNTETVGHVLWSDKSHFSIWQSNGWVKVWWFPWERPWSDRMVPSEMFGGENFMVGIFLSLVTWFGLLASLWMHPWTKGF